MTSPTSAIGGELMDPSEPKVPKIILDSPDGGEAADVGASVDEDDWLYRGKKVTNRPRFDRITRRTSKTGKDLKSASLGRSISRREPVVTKSRSFKRSQERSDGELDSGDHSAAAESSYGTAKRGKDRRALQKFAVINRTQAREEKKHSGEFNTPTMPNSGDSDALVMEVSSSANFKTLREIKSDSFKTEPLSGTSTPRQLSKSSEPSSLESRTEVYKLYSVLLKANENAFRQQESLTGSPHMQREERQKVKAGDLLFLFLTAWKAGLPIRGPRVIESLVRIDGELFRFRTDGQEVLTRIKNFRVSFPDQTELADAGSNVPIRSYSTPLAPDADSNGLVANMSRFSLQESSADGSGLWSDVSSEVVSSNDVNNENSLDLRPTDQLEDLDCLDVSDLYIQRQTVALQTVSKLLEDFESFTNNYPTYSLMVEDADQLFTGADSRLKVLYIWSNITRDLCRKTKQIGQMLEMHSGCDWPNIEYESPRISPVTETITMENSLSSANSFYTLAREAGLTQTDARYRRFVESSLRRTRTVLQRVTKIFGNTLFRARQALQVPKPIVMEDSHVKIVSQTKKRKSQSLMPLMAVVDSSSQSIAASPMGSSIISKSRLLKNKESPGTSDESSDHSLLMVPPTEVFDRDLPLFGVQTPLFKAMGLPTFLPSFLFLLKVPVKLVHHWLNLRREQKPRSVSSTDTATLLQLIHDAKDVLDAAVEVKRFYQENVHAVIGEAKVKEREKLMVTDMVEFEQSLASMFETYLDYISSWTLMTQTDSRWSTSVSVEDEWKFSSRVAIHTAQGEALAAKTFCNMAIRLFDSTENFLEKERADINEYPTEAEQLDLDDNSSDDLDALPDDSNTNCRKSRLLTQCRKLKSTSLELRNQGLKALSFAKMLRKDLEIASHFDLVCPVAELLGKLASTGHVLIRAFEEDDRLLMFVRKEVAADEVYLNLLLNVTCGRDESVEPRSIGKSGYLVLMKLAKCRNGLITDHWNGQSKTVSPDADTTIALSHIDALDGLYLVVVQSAALRYQRNKFQRHIGENLAVLADEMCSCHKLIAKNMDDLKDKALELRSGIATWLNEIQSVWDLEDEDDPTRHHWRDVVLEGYKVAFEYHREIVKLISGTKRRDLALSLKDFAIQWIVLIVQTCEKGKGVWPRWATTGLHFLRIVLEPRFTSFFSDEEFDHFKDEMNRCVQHILGDKSRQVVTTSPLHQLSLPGTLLSSKSWPCWPQGQAAAKGRSSHSTHSAPSGLTQELLAEPTSPIAVVPEEEDIAEMPLDFDVVDDKILTAVDKLEHKRQTILAAEKKIGRIVVRTDLQMPKISESLKKRRVNFKYLMTNNVLGSGSFGKVYQAVNLDANLPMAVKKLDMNNDKNQDKLVAYAEEIINFEGIAHPNLVRYYGVEYRNNELFIFMELCNEGTLEKACKEELPENFVRIYTLEILNGLNELHQRNIIHRDLKPQNIFLSSERQLLKLGDFGSFVKLRGQETQFGECRRYGGTIRYMSPEMIKIESTPSGYGRAIDIWSVGCIVLEMSTGKIPYHGYEDDWPVILKVGNGELPHIPESLSPDCKNFIRRCLVVDPEKRATVRELLEDPFVKVHFDYLSPPH